MAKILCIETATEVCSVALANDGELLSCCENADGHSHAEKIMELIDNCLKQGKTEAGQLQAICISSGPGSYTGLRIGTSAAKGMCYALSIPLLAVSSLEGIARGAAEAHPEITTFCPMIDARRMEVYCALYNPKGECLQKAHNLIVDKDSFKETLATGTVAFCGNGAPKCKELFAGNEACLFTDTLSSAAYLVPAAFRQWERKAWEDVAYFEPFYLKEFIAGKPHVKGL